MSEIRDKLIEELLAVYKDDKVPFLSYFTEKGAEHVADYLLKRGVIFPPCNVGDEVYVIEDGNVVTKEVAYYNKTCSKIDEQNEEYWRLTDKDGVCMSKIVYPEDFGKTVFLTKEEAGRAPEEGKIK